MKFGIFISKQHEPGADLVVRFHEHLDQVRAARDAGFDILAVGQHYLSSPFQELQTMPLLGRLAAECGDMRVAAGVLLLPLLNPVDVAEQVATLDVICEGRFVAGVGLGYREAEYEAFGVKVSDRVSRFTESIDLMKRLWTEEEVTHHGRFFRVTGASLGLRPVQKPHPPLWLAANNDRAVERAAIYGDAWMINPHAQLEVLERQVIIYRDALARAGKLFPAELPILKELYVAPDRRTALRECQPYLEGKYQTYTSWGQADALPEGEDFDLEFESLARDRFIVGDPDDCIREIRRYAHALGANCFLFRLQWPGMEQAKVLRSIRLLADHVLPAFAGEPLERPDHLSLSLSDEQVKK